MIFPLIVAAGHKSGDVLGLIGARTLAMLNAILSTYCNSSNKSNTRIQGIQEIQVVQVIQKIQKIKEI